MADGAGVAFRCGLLGAVFLPVRTCCRASMAMCENWLAVVVNDLRRTSAIPLTGRCCCGCCF